MKRTLLILSVLLLAFVLAAPARAHAEEDDRVRIQVDTLSGEKGDTVDLSVLLGDCEGVDSAQFDLNYDSAALEFVSMTPGDLFAAQYTVINADTPGRIRAACASALGLTKDGTIMTLRFRLLSDAGSAVTISNGIITRVDADYNQSAAFITITDGGITVGAAQMPAPVVTPWIPATPIPTPSPVPTPEPTDTPDVTQPQETTSPEIVAPPTTTLTASVYYVGGGLLLAVVVLLLIVLLRRNRK